MGVDIFVVFGETGGYSDYSEWMVAAYRDFDTAWEHREAAEKRYDELSGGKTVSFLSDKAKEITDKNQYDPFMSVDGSVYYTVRSVMLHPGFVEREESEPLPVSVKVHDI